MWRARGRRTAAGALAVAVCAAVAASGNGSTYAAFSDSSWTKATR